MFPNLLDFTHFLEIVTKWYVVASNPSQVPEGRHPSQGDHRSAADPEFLRLEGVNPQGGTANYLAKLLL